VSLLRLRAARALLAAAGLALLAAAPAVSGAEAQRASGLVVSGRGFGHGIGLSQWGAQKRAAAGESLSAILSFYYPGTTLGRAPATRVRVLLAERPQVRVGSRASFTIRDATGTVHRLPAGAHLLTADGRLAGRTLALPAAAHGGAAPVRLGGTGYPGTLALAAVGGRVRVVNELDLEEYLVGVVSSECPGYWHPVALRAQAVASRSYALASLRPDAEFDLYPDDRSQNYHGLHKYLPRAAAAVAATRGLVVRHGGEVAYALFSAANGGLTNVPDGIWEGDSPPYFAARRDPFDATSPATTWGPVKVSAAALRKAFPELPAEVASVAVARNAGRRATSVTFAGADGSTVTVGGYAFQQRLGLRSAYYTIATRP
jgi:SpoIID/LytB domain protein